MDGGGPYEQKLVDVLDTKGFRAESMLFTQLPKTGQFRIIFYKKDEGVTQTRTFTTSFIWNVTSSEAAEECCRKFLKRFQKFPIGTCRGWNLPVFPVLELNSEFSIVRVISEKEWRDLHPEYTQHTVPDVLKPLQTSEKSSDSTAKKSVHQTHPPPTPKVSCEIVDEKVNKTV